MLMMLAVRATRIRETVTETAHKFAKMQQHDAYESPAN